jgi:hypothetical protein
MLGERVLGWIYRELRWVYGGMSVSSIENHAAEE